MQSAFVAYASTPPDVGATIDTAIPQIKSSLGLKEITSWRENEIAGRFLVTPILQHIEECECLIADITTFNFNVAFEIGYALGKKRRVVLIRNSAIEGDSALLPQLGLFDTLGYEPYSSPQDLVDIVRQITPLSPLSIPRRHSSGRPRLFLLEPPTKTHFDISVRSSVKKSKVAFETYDPSERGRLSAQYAIESVAKNDAVVACLLSHLRTDHLIHNTRVSFCAGLAFALGRDHLLLQESVDPVPLDYRELATWIQSAQDVSQAVGSLVLSLYGNDEISGTAASPVAFSVLERVNLGSSIAENETKSLENYYLPLESFKSASRGEVQLITGRKGAGKTAFFIELRNLLRRNRQNIVLDLQPEGFQMLKFKERCLALLSNGSKEHLLAALWEYVLLLEIANRIVRDDRSVHVHNHLLNQPYARLSSFLAATIDPCAAIGTFGCRQLQSAACEHKEVPSNWKPGDGSPARCCWTAKASGKSPGW